MKTRQFKLLIIRSKPCKLWSACPRSSLTQYFVPLARKACDRVGGEPLGSPTSHRTVRTGPYTALQEKETRKSSGFQWARASVERMISPLCRNQLLVQARWTLFKMDLRHTLPCAPLVARGGGTPIEISLARRWRGCFCARMN